MFKAEEVTVHDWLRT